MNFGSFMITEDFDTVRKSILKREKFNFENKCKDQGNAFRMVLYSSFIDEDLAKRVWNGHDYLVHFGIDYKGKLIGQGGFGRGLDQFDMFENLDSFKKWFDEQMKWYGNYEREEYGQMSLF